MEITREFTFDSAHILPNHSGKCKRLHGHTYRMQVTLESDAPFQFGASSEGMLLDFTMLDEIVKTTIVNKWDHRFLSAGDEWPFQCVPDEQIDHICLVHVRTTAENLAYFAAYELYKVISTHFGPKEFYVTVQLWETPKSSAKVLYPQLGQQWEALE